MAVNPVFIVLTLLVGGLSALQVGVNGLLGQVVGHPLRAAFVNFSVGATALGMSLLGLNILLGGAALPPWSFSAPWYYWLGGLFGSVFVLSTIVIAPQIGASTFAVAIIAGQLTVAALLDHFGVLGFAQHPLTLGRVLGIVLLFTGVWLIQRH